MTSKEACKPAVGELETSNNPSPIISTNTTSWVEFTVGGSCVAKKLSAKNIK